MAKTVVHKSDAPYFGDEKLLEIAPERKFSDMIFELLSERRPSSTESKLFETILNLSIDHGKETPSTAETLKRAKDGKTLSESVSGGMLQINERHGGAIEGAMKMFYKIDKERLDVSSFVKEALDKEIKLPGFGHRFYEVDPRTQLLFKIMNDEGISDVYLKMAKSIERELEDAKDRKLPINVDGAIAVVLCTFEWDPEVGNAVFLISRTPGLVGHFLNFKK